MGHLDLFKSGEFGFYLNKPVPKVFVEHSVDASQTTGALRMHKSRLMFQVFSVTNYSDL